MKITFLAQTEADLRWFKTYYVVTFPEGRKKADAQFLKPLQFLRSAPMAGHVSETCEGGRELHIQRTPFTFIYRVQADAIQVLRVVDERSAGPSS